MTAFYLGLDGGATKTEAVLVDGSGGVRGLSRGPGSAIVGDPHDDACGVLRTVAAEACAESGTEPGDVTACGLGLNGIDFADQFDGQHAGLSACLGLAPRRLHLVNDGIIALWAATDAPAAAIVQCGSGFTSAYRSQPGEEALFDHLNAGGMFDMRSALTRAVARMIDGRMPETPLLETALVHYGGVSRAAYPELLYRQRIDRERLRSTPPLIFAAWREGDEVATDLVERAAADFVATAAAMVARTGRPDVTVAFGGGVIVQGEGAFQQLLCERLREVCPAARATRPQFRPAVGGALMAAHRAGADAAALFAVLRDDESPLAARILA
jgi:N-acetylglucosamine kinase-like BadF-type ATPase